MRFIPSRIHAILDYGAGLVLIALPYLLGFADGTAAQYVMQAVGAALLLMSLCTDYELSAVKLIPLPVHLGADVAAGLLLVVSPWLFGFADRVTWPHVVMGVLEIGAGLTTRAARDDRIATSTGASA
ncbi:SPW repeat domain-containing protein [Methylobacterium frigidaeris]|uniref:SPW repeat-containing integral membrane domain-containing protein n=1 Tax=Methylobacterium frigidaeris TaxID=2038277 RepID=A0AA37M7Q6_9HYPH|nr:SPW repeat protein [Methylobacterium frigidaeris]GJD66263.1 hypothetical protein MPEAHAMD_6460 [Methylobacterium frigidaeris]